MSSQSGEALPNDYRAEAFSAAGDWEEPPFWLSVEAPDGTQRSEAQAVDLINAEFDEPWALKAACVPMYVGLNEYRELCVHRDPEGMLAGPFDFWQMDEE